MSGEGGTNGTVQNQSPENNTVVSPRSKTDNIRRMSTVADAENPLGFSLHMLGQKNGGRPRGEAREVRSTENEQPTPSNRFGHLMDEHPGNLHESLQVTSHNSPSTVINYATAHAKKQWLEKGPRNVAIPKQFQAQTT